MLDLNFMTILKMLPNLLLAFTVHEVAHTYTAYLLGDSTAKHQGRLTFNPLTHIDPLGFLALLIAGFGWAKPVQFDPRNFKEPKRDQILVAMAGPLSNLLLSCVFLLIIKSVYTLFPYGGGEDVQVALELLVYGIYMNLGLFVFNLLPIPPLDGSHLYMPFLEQKRPELHWKLRNSGFSIVLLIIIAEELLGVNLLPLGAVIDGIIMQMFKIL